MTFAIWAVVLGLLLITMAMTGALLKRLPVSPSMLYLAAGAALGPAGVALLHLDPINDSTVLEHMAPRGHSSPSGCVACRSRLATLGQGQDSGSRYYSRVSTLMRGMPS